MKQLITSLFLMSACLANAQSSEVLPGTTDTINHIDAAGKKQGNWIVMGKHKPGQCFKPTQKIEEGAYSDNRKKGTWLEYYCNGNKKNEAVFVNGRPDGFATAYYENGNKKEEGVWKVNKWVGNYKLYYDNGQVQHDFKFNNIGKREGIQTYKYENGKTAIVGTFVGGKESGEIKEFYPTGEIKAIKNYNNGDVDVATIKTFESKEEIVKTNDAIKFAPSKAESEIKAEEKIENKTILANTLNGKHILYNKNKQVSKDGVFKDNRLMEGKAFIYNENGILSRVAIYKNGIYVGDGNIEN